MGLSYLHSKHILHRDIKCLNMLVDSRNNLKIGDLGVSKLLSSTTAHLSAKAPRVGTPLYLAPEIIRNQGYSFKVDVWAAGCVLYQLASLHPPFKGENILALNNCILHKPYKELPPIFSAGFHNLVDCLLDKNPEKRVTVD